VVLTVCNVVWARIVLSDALVPRRTVEDYRVRCRRRAKASASAPAISDERPTMGPDSELPVKGRAPVPVFALVRADTDVEVAPSTAVTGEIVDDGATVEP
jgi:hypothetical protein